MKPTFVTMPRNSLLLKRSDVVFMLGVCATKSMAAMTTITKFLPHGF
jgi:hypothetical protein